MFPYLTSGIRTYAIAIIVGMILSFAVSMVTAMRMQIPWFRFFVLQISCGICLVLGAKIYGGFSYDLGTGYRYPGALAGFVVALLALGPLLLPEVGVARLADVFVPGAAVRMACIRIGCFLAGCCYGTPSNLPWAVRFPARSLAWSDHLQTGLITPFDSASAPVHPLELYFLFNAVLAGVVACWFLTHDYVPGRPAGVFLLLHEGGKATLETFRAPSQAVPGLQMASAVAAAFAFLILVRVSQHRPAPPRTVSGSLSTAPPPSRHS